VEYSEFRLQITGTVRKMLEFETDVDIEKFVKDWLKAAPARFSTAQNSVV